MKSPTIQLPQEKSAIHSQGADSGCCGKCEKAELGTCGKLDKVLAALKVSTAGGRVEV